jgi:hypothetical protein
VLKIQEIRKGIRGNGCDAVGADVSEPQFRHQKQMARIVSQAVTNFSCLTARQHDLSHRKRRDVGKPRLEEKEPAETEEIRLPDIRLAAVSDGTNSLG